MSARGSSRSRFAGNAGSARRSRASRRAPGLGAGRRAQSRAASLVQRVGPTRAREEERRDRAAKSPRKRLAKACAGLRGRRISGAAQLQHIGADRQPVVGRGDDQVEQRERAARSAELDQPRVPPPDCWRIQRATGALRRPLVIRTSGHGGAGGRGAGRIETARRGAEQPRPQAGQRRLGGRLWIQPAPQHNVQHVGERNGSAGEQQPRAPLVQLGCDRAARILDLIVATPDDRLRSARDRAADAQRR